MKPLSNIAQNLAPSGIRQMFSLAAKYDNVISLGMGEPGFNTPQHIIDAGCSALQSGHTKYVDNAGIMGLRKAIAEKMNRVNGFNVTADNVIVNFGACQSIMSSMQAILDEGDEILVVTPCYTSYFSYVQMARAVAVSVPTYEKDHFHIKADVMEKYITPKTKAMILCTPGNPTGAVIPREDLEEVAKLAIKYDLYVISDEPYESIIFDGREHFSIGTLPGMFERTLTVNSFSKTYAMTGWRLGYTVAREDIIASMKLIQAGLTANIPDFVQLAGIEALNGDQSCVKMMSDEYEKRAELLTEGLNQIKGISCNKPEGAFYVFANISETGMSSRELAMKLLEEVHVVTVPGDCFGEAGKDFLRFSCAASEENIREGLERIKKCLGTK